MHCDAAAPESGGLRLREGGWGGGRLGCPGPAIRAAPTRPCKRISPLLRSLEGNNKKKKVITVWGG